MGQDHQEERRRERKVRVAVVFGGRSDEHDVSLRSAQTIMGALDQGRYEVVPVGITRTGQWLVAGDPMAQLVDHSPMFHPELAAGDGATPNPETALQVVDGATKVMPAGITEAVDVVFPALHGPFGEDGTVQGMLELADLPYVGSGVLGSAVAMDKATTKTILAQAGISQVPWVTVYRNDFERDPGGVAAAVAKRLGYPCFVKPANLGSSVGISKATDADSLVEALRVASHYDRKLVVEQGIDAREIELSVLGNDDPMASVAGEIVPKGEFYDYASKYIDDTAELIVPAKLEADVLAQLQAMAIEAFRALDLAGLARVDFFIDRNNDRIYLNEVNTLPGFTSISMYPMLWEASGVPLTALVERLIELAIERHAEKRR